MLQRAVKGKALAWGAVWRSPAGEEGGCCDAGGEMGDGGLEIPEEFVEAVSQDEGEGGEGGGEREDGEGSHDEGDSDDSGEDDDEEEMEDGEGV